MEPSKQANHLAAQTLWSKLADANLVRGEMPTTDVAQSIWYIRLLQGFAGWIAAFFLLAFFATTLSWIFDRENAFALIAVGVLGNTVAYSLFRASKTNEFLHQLGLVINLCGQLMVAWGLYETFHSFNSGYFLILCFYQALLVFAIPDYVSRVLTTWFSVFALFASFSRIGIFNLAAALAGVMFALIWLNDLKWKKNKKLWEPIGYGLAISMLQFNGQLLFGDDLSWWFKAEQLSWFNVYTYWLSELIVSAFFLTILLKLAKQYQIGFRTSAGALMIMSGFLMIALSHFIIGVGGSLLLLLLGFMKQRRMLVGLGVIAFLGFISWYYYSLQLSLLTKSIILIALGTALLIGFYVLMVYLGGKTLSLNNLKTKYRMSKTKWTAVGVMIIALSLVNINIYKKEQILENGQIVLLELAPVDPRSIMQGDYMNLRFAIERTLLGKNQIQQTENSSNILIVNLDENSVGRFAKIDNGETPDDGQIKMQFKIRHSRIRLATNAFFFQEGTASEYEKAKYGEFRVDSNGELLLNNLRDESFNILGYNRPNQ